MLADTGVVPIPIWCEEDLKNIHTRITSKDIEQNSSSKDTFYQFCGFSGIYASLMRDFHRIWKYIHQRMPYFDKLYVTGHSMGGGLAILFALQSLINGYLPPTKRMKVIVFGSPVVISYDSTFEDLSYHSRKYLSQLHNICHCFVNRFDPIARIPAKPEWVLSVIPYAMKKIISDQVRTKLKLPSFLMSVVKSSVKSGLSKFVSYFLDNQSMLCSYHPFGTYYFCFSEFKAPVRCKNPKIIEKIMSFTPPHHMITSTGAEVRVTHYSMYDSKKYGKRRTESLEEIQAQAISDKLRKEGRTGNGGGSASYVGSSRTIFSVKGRKKRSKSLSTVREFKAFDYSLDDCETGLTLFSSVEKIMQAAENDNDIIPPENVFIRVKSAGEIDFYQEVYHKHKLDDRGWVSLMSCHLIDKYVELFHARTQINERVKNESVFYVYLCAILFTEISVVDEIIDCKFRLFWNKFNENEYGCVQQ